MARGSIGLATLLPLLALVLWGCGEDPTGYGDPRGEEHGYGNPPVEQDWDPLVWEVVLDPANPRLKVGEEIQLTGYFSNDYQTHPVGQWYRATWTSSDPTVARVQGPGETVALSQGEALITLDLWSWDHPSTEPRYSASTLVTVH